MSGQNIETYDRSFKIVVIGRSKVGKSSFILRYTDAFFTDDTLPTIGADFRTVTVNSDDEKIKLRIWDTAGKERFKPGALGSLINSADGIIVMYDITSKSSWEAVPSMINDIRSSSDALVLLCGNKTDMDYLRDINVDVGSDFATEHDLMSTELSVRKNAGNVTTVMNRFVLALQQGTNLEMDLTKLKANDSKGKSDKELAQKYKI